MDQVIPRAKQLWKEISDDDITGLGAELAYRFFLALFPFAIFLAAMGGVIARAAGIDNPSQEALDLLGDNLPADARSILSDQVAGVVESKDPVLLSFGIIGTIWAASGAMGAVMKSLNKAFDVKETRPFWKKTGFALGLTLLSASSIVIAFSVLIAGQAFAQDLADWMGMGRAFEIVLFWVRIPVALVMIMFVAAFVYWAAPNTDTPFKLVTPGAVLFTITWLAASTGFAWYVSSFGSYNATYGTLGGVVILLTWFYLTSVMLLVGAELNAMLQAALEGEPQPSDRQEQVQKELEGQQAARAGGKLEEGDFELAPAGRRPNPFAERGTRPASELPSRAPLYGLGAALAALAAAFVLRRVVH